MKEKESRLLTVIFAVVLGALLLSTSIAAPILCRPFYYAHIDALHLTETTPWTEEEIRQAYDEMLDFCILGTPFGTGALRWSESGRSHFADAAALFHLDFAVGIAAGAGLLACLFLYRRRKLRPHRFLGRGPGFWGGLLLAAAFAVVTVLAASDFDRAFVVFHTIFFPGKDNWIFDPAVDEIILILPQDFFMNCAICIVAVLLVCCACLILTDLAAERRKKKIPAGV